MSFMSDNQSAVLSAFYLYRHLMDLVIKRHDAVMKESPENEVFKQFACDLENTELCFSNVLEEIGYLSLEEAKFVVKEHLSDDELKSLGEYDIQGMSPHFDERIIVWRG